MTSIKFVVTWEDVQDIAKQRYGQNLRRAVVEKIKAYEAENLKRGDLMAVRNKPYMFHGEPYNFLWVLHRYQNHRPNMVKV
jgi:hypothetical protein